MSPITTLARRLWTAFTVAASPVNAHLGRHYLVPMPLLSLVLRRMWRLIARFDRLVLAWERDQLPTPRLRAPRPATARKAPTPALRLPARFGWLGKLVPAAQAGAGPLAHMLWEQPDEARALVAAAPQAGRILRPLCRIFGVTPPDWLKLPRRPRKPRPAKPAAPPRLRQTPARGFTRRQIEAMTGAELKAHYGPLPPHFPLPIPNLNLIRRKIAAG